ncbi:WRKY transcription factor [Quillaja saponaria]|uniref:WRKY transcription factor n=1 Tax=Quillaja saponaria TaxID=32244 RepID=A0AAD7KTL6_QUISA|nr:WRKY transcription factor [Quillaja saponaria]
MENFPTIFFPSSSSTQAPPSSSASLNLGSSHDFQVNISEETDFVRGSNIGSTTFSNQSKSFGGKETDNQVKVVGTKKGEKKIRKAKYAFQTRSQVDILDDGYRWRKYGQKAVKNNKFPRSYYRCTHKGCNVKKQVQRLTKDEGVVVTTYEGMHSHPIDKSTDNFEHILSQMQIYSSV